MTRNGAQTVTFPILVPLLASEKLKDAAGWSPVSSDDPALTGFVRRVTTEDAHQWLRKNATRPEAALYLGASRLKGAYDAKDEYALRRAYETLRPFIRGLPSPGPSEIPLKTKDGKKMSLLIGGQTLGTALETYSKLMTESFKNARFVMWFSEQEGRLLPSLYCPNWMTAAFVVLFTGRIRVCLRPSCNTIFIPAAGNVDYHAPACREAHRMDRSRWRAKQLAKGSKKPKSAKQTGVGLRRL